jgi:hypothetical protein
VLAKRRVQASQCNWIVKTIDCVALSFPFSFIALFHSVLVARLNEMLQAGLADLMRPVVAVRQGHSQLILRELKKCQASC